MAGAPVKTVTGPATFASKLQAGMSLKIAWLIGALAVAGMAWGQEPVAAEAARAAARFFQPDPAETPLACEVRPLAPALSYRLVYRAGYSVSVPMEQFARRQSALKALVRVTPKRAGTQPLLLEEAGDLPDKPAEQPRDTAKFEAQFEGHFYLGAGAYHAELVLTDGQRRFCRKQWDLELKPRKDVEAALAPGQLAALSQLDWPEREAGRGSATVFLNAGPARGNPLLLAALDAALSRMAFRHVQVVVFSLDQRKELLRREVTGAAGLRQVAEALSNHNPSVVSYQVLQDPAGNRDFLRRLLARDTQLAEPPEAVFFFGYPTIDDSHVNTPPPEADGSRKTLYAYFDFAQPGSRSRLPAPGLGPSRRRGRMRPEAERQVPRPTGPEMPDAISRTVRAHSGKVYPIHSPDELATALRKTSERLRAER